MPVLVAREDLEAEVERLRLLLTEAMFFVGYAEQMGVSSRSRLFRDQVAAALTRPPQSRRSTK
jgi:hypothetical protein